MSSSVSVAASADVSPSAEIGAHTQIWDMTTVRDDVQIGTRCILGRGVYVDTGVHIGDRSKIQNNAQIFAPARLGNGVFVGPGAILTNDRVPRAATPDNQLKSATDWQADGVVIEDGASVGAGSVILAGTHIGAYALIGAGAVVINDVPAHALVVGSPARRVGWVGVSGRRLEPDEDGFRDPDGGARFVESTDGNALLKR